MSLDDDKINLLIQRIYDAALDDALWPALIRDLARLIGAKECQLFTPRLDDCREPLLLSPFEHTDRAELQAYDDYYWQHDVWVNHSVSQHLVYSGSIVHGDQFIERQAFRQTEIYCDFFKPLPVDIEVLMGVCLIDQLTLRGGKRSRLRLAGARHGDHHRTRSIRIRRPCRLRKIIPADHSRNPRVETAVTAAKHQSDLRNLAYRHDHLAQPVERAVCKNPYPKSARINSVCLAHPMMR